MNVKAKAYCWIMTLLDIAFDAVRDEFLLATLPEHAPWKLTDRQRARARSSWDDDMIDWGSDAVE